MSTRREIVRYKGNTEAVFPPRCSQTPGGGEKQLRKQLSEKLALRHSNFGCPTVQ